MSHSPKNDSYTLGMWPFLDFKCEARHIPNILLSIQQDGRYITQTTTKVKQQAAPKVR